MRYFLALLLFPFTLFAIIDIASVDFGEKEKGFSGSAYGSFQTSRGNTNKDEAEYGGRIQYDTNKTITWLQGSAEDDKVNGQSNANNVFLHLRHIRQLYSPSWAMEYYTQFRSDKFKNLEGRTLFGVGPRYKIADSKQYGKLFVGLSVMDETIEYTEYLIDPNEHNYRASSYLSYSVNIGNNLEFSYLGYYQPEIDHSSDYLVSSMAELTIHLTKVFDLSYLIEFDYDSVPAHDVARTDTRQKLSFVYRFGKNDPLSGYASNILGSIDTQEAEESPIVMDDEIAASSVDIQLEDSLEGKWVYENEIFTFVKNGQGNYVKDDGVYNERFIWTLVASDEMVHKNAKFIRVRFEDEEGRPGRIENYLWNENTIVGLSNGSVRLFKR